MAKGALVFGQWGLGNASHRYRFGITHKPEGKIEDVDTDIDRRTATTILLVDKAGAYGQPTTAQHPTAGMINFPQRAIVDLGLHRLRNALEAKMLRGHQGLAGTITSFDHAVDVGGGGGKWLFADHMFAGIERRDGQFGVIHVGRADIDDIDIGVVDDVSGIGA